MSDDPGETAISQAVHADAETAREQLRAAGLVCPSCRRNLADIYGSHSYENLDDAGIPQAFNDLAATLKCTDGEPIPVAGIAADWDKFQAVANIAVLDEAWRRESRWFDEHAIGTGPANFTGFLDALGRA